MTLPFVFRILSPFIAGFFLYLAANPLNRFFLKRGIPRALSAILSLLIISAAVFFVLRAIIIKIIVEITALSENADFFYNTAFSDLSQKAAVLIRRSDLPEIVKVSTENFMPSFFETIKNYLLQLATDLGGVIINILKNIPSMLVWTFTAVFTTFFLLKEEDGIASFSEKFFGKRLCALFIRIKKSFLSVTFSYIKAQLIIEAIVFVVLLTGFFLLNMEYAFLLALITAIVDAVPILGTGTVLVPMSIINFLMGNNSLSWALLILYGIALLVRQLCEPKILGSKLGIHPLATVFAMYAGMKIFGILGLIFGPIIAIFLKNLVNAEKV